jgi:hypothetical protein
LHDEKERITLDGNWAATFAQWVPALLFAPLFLTTAHQGSNIDQVVSSRIKQLCFWSGA